MIGAELGYRTSIPDHLRHSRWPEHAVNMNLTTWPSARLPHVWLNDGAAIQDRIRGRIHDFKLGRSSAPMFGLAKALLRTAPPQ